MRRLVLAAAIVAWPTAALADDEGAACAITADCSEGLRCIEGACVSVTNGKAASIVIQKERSAGDAAWVGDGHGYVAQVVVGDVVATVTAGALVAAAFGTGQGWLAFAALFPTTLTAPIIHAANGRGGPAAISFAAWAAVPPTITFFSFVAAFGSADAAVFAIVGYTIGVGCAAGLTTLDAFFARTARARPSRRDGAALSIIPSVTPSRNGFTAGVAGTF